MKGEILIVPPTLQSRSESESKMEINKRGVEDLFADILYQDQDDHTTQDAVATEEDEYEEEGDGGGRSQEEGVEVAGGGRRMALIKSSRFSRSSDSFR